MRKLCPHPPSSSAPHRDRNPFLIHLRYLSPAALPRPGNPRLRRERPNPPQTDTPVLSAPSAILMEASTGTILYDKESSIPSWPRQRHPKSCPCF